MEKDENIAKDDHMAKDENIAKDDHMERMTTWQRMRI